jgi:hypothetical protein
MTAGEASPVAEAPDIITPYPNTAQDAANLLLTEINP